MASSSDTAHGYLDLLRRRPDYRNLWFGQLISFVGDWFNFIALYTAVQEISSTGKAVATVMVVKMVPIFLMAPIAGPLADRIERRRLLIASDIARAALAVGLVVSYQLHSLIGLYACTVVMMCCTGIAVPTKNAILPMIVPRNELAAANALFGGTWSIMLAIGAALGGVTTASLGITAALLIDGATFVISALFFARLPLLQPPALSASTPTPELGGGQQLSSEPRTTFADGLRYLWRHPYVMTLVSLKSLMQLSGGLVALIPFYGTRVFSEADGPMFVGLLFAVRGVGAALGSLGVRVAFGDEVRTMRRLLLVGYLVAGTSYFALSLAGSYLHAVAAFFFAALGQSTVWVFSGTLLQIEADLRYHGRVFAIEFGLNTLILGVASFLAGAALDWGYSFSQVCVAFSTASLVPITLWSLVLIGRRHTDG